MFAKKYLLSIVCLSAAVAGHSQTSPEAGQLAPDQVAERNIAGGESHTYRIKLAEGQFARVVLANSGVDTGIMLAGPHGKKVTIANVTAIGGSESISIEASASGEHLLTVRAAGTANFIGSYRVQLEVKPSASTRDRQRIAAEGLISEAHQLQQQGGPTAEKTIDRLQRALIVWRELDDRYWTAWTICNIGITYSSLTRYEKAVEYCEQALVLYREINNRAGEGLTLSALTHFNYALGRLDKAIEHGEQALAANREAKAVPTEGITLGTMGFAYTVLSRYEKAIEHFEQALLIARDVKNRHGEGGVLGGLANANRMLGRFEKSIEYYEQALSIARESKNMAGEGIFLNSLGSVYYSLNRYDKAIEYYERSVVIAREVKNRSGEGTALNNLGNANEMLGRGEKAIAYYEEALAIAREVKNLAGEAGTLSSLGSNYFRLGRYEKASEYYEQALAINRAVKSRAAEGNSLTALADVYYSSSRFDKAIEYYRQALEINRETKDRIGEAATLRNWAGADRELGNFAAARDNLSKSLEISESMRSGILSPESRASFLSSVQGSYQLYTDVLMRQFRADPTKGSDALALETSERQRARSLLDMLSEAHADVRQGIDTALLEKESTLSRRLSDKAEQLDRANQPEQADELRKEISQLETELERAQVAIRQASPRYASLMQPRLVKLSEIQAELDPNTVLLEYSLGSTGQRHSYLWAITRDSLTSYELPKVEVIEKNARDLYELLTARSSRKHGETTFERDERISAAEAKLPAAALELSKMILAPAADQLGSKRLVIVADGALQYIPFSMLPDPAYGNNQPLVVGHEIVSLPSASTLLFQRKELAGRPAAPKMLAVIADPVFDRSDIRFKKTGPNEKTVGPAGAASDTRGLEHIADQSATPGRFVIRRLPFTRQEADALISLTPKGSSFKAIDFQANRTNVLNGELSQYKYVHFATHGVMDAQRPGLSSLVLSTVDADGKQQNGFLRANDIYNMKLPAELVVLSACQTGLGKEVKGEGLIGLTRGFMYAGAKRVVVSLWSVNDKATSDLMTKFYRGMLKDNERPAAALRAAQIEMWKQKKWQSPYYWAAFTMQGEWR